MRAAKSILKSLRSLSLAAQIDVRPCFTFNSIGQKTAAVLSMRKRRGRRDGENVNRIVLAKDVGPPIFGEAKGFALRSLEALHRRTF